MQRDQGGEAAVGWIIGAEHWVDVAEVATFRFSPGAAEVLATAHPSATAAEVQHAFDTTVLPLAAQTLGYEALHASAVHMAFHGIAAFCGLSGAGKTTIAHALGRRGHAIWADDALVFALADGRDVPCVPLPFNPNMRADSQAYFRATGDEAVRRATNDDRRPLAAIFRLERSPAPKDERSNVEIRRLSAGAALSAILPHAHRFSLRDTTRKARTLRTYMELLARVPIFGIRFDTSLDELPGLVSSIERTVEEAAAEIRG